MEHSPNPERKPAHGDERESFSAIERLIQSGVDVARVHGRDIDSTTARLIGHLVAESGGSHLGLWAQGLERNNATLRAEYLPVYLDPDTPPQVREWIDWLGEHIVHAENPAPRRQDRVFDVPRLSNILWHLDLTRAGGPETVFVAADAAPDAIVTLPLKLNQMIDEHGEAMRIYLGFNDVDATNDGLLNDFSEHYVGEFESVEEVLAELTDATDIYAAIRGIAEKFIGGEHILLDTDGLWDRVREEWQIVERDQKFYVFER